MVDRPSDNQESTNEQSNASSAPIMRRYGRRAGDAQGSSAWLVSFTDVMALMLTFFVLLFAMSHPKEEEWDEFTDTVQENFNRFNGQVLNRGQQDAINIEKVNWSKALDLNY
jgi:chemotaxis protein MotB